MVPSVLRELVLLEVAIPVEAALASFESMDSAPETSFRDDDVGVGGGCQCRGLLR